MKKVEKPTEDIGIVIGRFQVHELHSAHLDLIQSVCNEHEKVIIFLGLSPLMVTSNNPLDFESRKQMILESFPKVIVMYIKDNPSDEVWSKDLDEKIRDLASPTQSVVLYGSRDSFITHYSGKYRTQELMQETYISGSEIRKNISKKVKSSADFRAGVIWASGNRFPTCFPCVDIAIFNEDYSKILLARKAKETLYRFVGGFADPKSDCYETDARREVQEETGLEIGDLKYLGSTIINDFRYRREIDKVKTLFFVGKILFGRPEANDDICEVKFFDIDKLTATDMIPEHKPLFDMLQKYLKKS
jgi:bifunctional NMN adenylyltransferase/nudix hydrolase